MDYEHATLLNHAVVEVAESRLPPPLLTYVGGRHWRLEADYAYRDDETMLTVPAGFRFDRRRCRARSGG